jgi:hypothetical protein
MFRRILLNENFALWKAQILPKTTRQQPLWESSDPTPDHQATAVVDGHILHKTIQQHLLWDAQLLLKTI